MFKRFLINYLIGDGKLAGYIRHILSFGAGIAVSRGLLSVDQATNLTDALFQILTTPEIIGGITAFAAGQSASIANKDLH